jgi:hypothetical protein
MKPFPTLWDLHPKIRLDVMTAMIVAPPGWKLRPYTESKRWKGTPGFGPFPLKWVRDAERLCAFYNCKFTMTPGDEESGSGWFQYWKKDKPGEICLLSIPEEDGTCFMPSWQFVATLAHELSHAIQWKFYNNPIRHLPGYGKRLSVQLAWEIEASRLSVRVWKKLMYDTIPDIPPKEFRCYMTKKSRLFLLEEWPGMVDDIGLTGQKHR